MNRMTRAILALFFITVIAVGLIAISHQWFGNIRLDLTEQGIYTLSDGTKQILAGLKQPITVKLFYTRTKNPNDQISYYNNYFNYVKALLEEYESVADGKIKLEIVDPEPYSQEELAAIRYGLRRFPLSEDENFIFGLVVQTQFGATKTIEFFTPDRQQLIEYDISYLMDTAVTREKKRLGVLSSINIMGDTGYMAQMKRMQGQQPNQKWGIIRQLEEKYEITMIPTDTVAITDVDFLLVIQPKDLPEQTLFAIDQFVLQGGRAIVAVDPYAVSDVPDMNQRMGGQFIAASNLPVLLDAWGLVMPDNTFAADRTLWDRAISVIRLQAAHDCFNQREPMTAQLNEVNTIFPGVLKQLEDAPAGLTYTPLLTTSNAGNTYMAAPQQLADPDYPTLMRQFRDGTEPVTLACEVSGIFQSAFPNGIEVPVSSDENTPSDDDNAPGETEIRTGLTESQQPGVVVVLADVDMISNLAAYNPQVYQAYGILMPVGDNSTFVMNAIEALSGSSDLIAIRSRGNFRRPFVQVDEIEARADTATADEEARIMAQIQNFERQLNEKIASIEGENRGAVINQTIVEEKEKIELELREAEKQLRDIKMQKREQVESVKARLWMFCTLPGPALILLIAIGVSIYRAVKRRRYISHASDA